GLKGVRWRDEIARRQAELWEQRRRWKGVDIGHGRVVDPELARQGLASAGSSADRVWLDVMGGQAPGLLGGLSAGEVPMKPAAGLGRAADETGKAILEELKKHSTHLERIEKNQAGDQPAKAQVPPAMPARPSGGPGRL